jgi:hypothetical protein
MSSAIEFEMPRPLAVNVLALVEAYLIDDLQPAAYAQFNEYVANQERYRLPLSLATYLASRIERAYRMGKLDQATVGIDAIFALEFAVAKHKGRAFRLPYRVTQWNHAGTIPRPLAQQGLAEAIAFKDPSVLPVGLS